jgi:C4-dicarboxylate-specific signal transduction histidine kinase
VDLAAVIADAAALATARLREHRVALRTELAPDLPPVLAKAVPLELVLLHLITNACDAYGVHGVAVAADRVIRVRAEAAGGRIVIGVSDLAGGIPEGDLTNIFQPFFTTRTVGLGTGLGLSVSFGIITELGGTITAANLDGGAEFRIVLPAAGAA